MKSLITVCGKEIRVDGRLLRIARLEADKYHYLDNPQAMLQGLRECGTRIDLFTFLQELPGEPPKFDYPMEWDNLAVLPVSTFDHWWKNQIGGFPRNRARQAEKKGVTIREVTFDDRLVQGMWGVYNESPLRQGRPNTHFGKDIATIRRLEATFLDWSIFIGAFLGEELIGFVKLVTDENRTQANMMNIVSMTKHRDKAPTNALIAQSVRSCAERGIRYLVYQNFVYGHKKPDSLARFKEVNGFSRVNLPRYYIPLSRVGHAAFRLGLHHRFVDHLPGPLVDRLVELRYAWYTRKLQSATETS
ncbi:MAG TPA: hypothetical protein VJO16_06705 [Candidatus Acidoferrum sp.]|nr:hypothetical protein [Candidatus Acidoferrum sp.]